MPTINESGLPGFSYDTGWHVWFAPAKTPAAIVDNIHAEIRKAVQKPKLKDYFIAGGYNSKADTPAEFQKSFRADIKRCAELVQAAKIKAQ